MVNWNHIKLSISMALQMSLNLFLMKYWWNSDVIYMIGIWDEIWMMFALLFVPWIVRLRMFISRFRRGLKMVCTREMSVTYVYRYEEIRPNIYGILATIYSMDMYSSTSTHDMHTINNGWCICCNPLWYLVWG